MTDTKKPEESEMIIEFNALLKTVPASAVKIFPPLKDIVSYIGKIIRRVDSVDDRLKALENKG